MPKEHRGVLQSTGPSSCSTGFGEYDLEKTECSPLTSFDAGLAEGLSEKVKIEGNFKQECILLVGAKIFVTPVVGFPHGNRPLLSKTIHLMISLGSVSGLYRQDHFDGYDYIFCAGPRQIEELSTLFSKRNLKNKV